MVGVHQRVAAARRRLGAFDRGPRAPRVVGHVDGQLVAPVAIDLRRRHPLAVEEARLHRVLHPEAVEDRPAPPRPPAPTVPVRYSGGRVELATGHAGEPHLGRRVRAARRSRPRAPGSGRTCCRRGTCAVVARHGVAVDRPHAAFGRGAGSRPARASSRRSVASHVRAGAHPSPSPVGGSAVLPSRPRTRGSWPPTSSPPIGQNHRREALLAGARLERRRRGRGATVVEAEARPVLHHRGVVGERRLGEPSATPGWSMNVSWKSHRYRPSTERIDVLVVVADHRSHPIAGRTSLRPPADVPPAQPTSVTT